MCPVQRLKKFGKKEKHWAFNRCHSCQLITNGVLVKNIVELIKKRHEDELERKRVKAQRNRQSYGGPIRIYTATKDSLRSLRIAMKLGSVKPTPQPESCVEFFDATTNREIAILDPFPAKENNTFMAVAACCDKKD
ncbi:hypothetical protein ACE6H2_001394 [Prunus campanulata]